MGSTPTDVNLTNEEDMYNIELANGMKILLHVRHFPPILSQEDPQIIHDNAHVLLDFLVGAPICNDSSAGNEDDQYMSNGE